LKVLLHRHRYFPTLGILLQTLLTSDAFHTGVITAR
jgi:hypothetical protein